MAYSTISKPSLHFNTVLYSGDDATTRNITGFGFQPDFIWNKARSAAYNHYLVDAVRGSPGNVIIANLNNGQDNDSGFQNSFKGFVADGNTIGQVGGYEVNDSGVNYVEWGWKANGQGSSNTDGSINTTYTSVNTTAGFSISKYTGTGSGATVGHGLGVKPKMIFFKNLSTTANWVYQSTLLANRTQLVLNGTDAQNTDSRLGNLDSWSNSVFSLGTYGDMNASGSSHVAYCFAEIKGYSKIGTYKGNGSTDGTFVYTGFKPAFIIHKRTDSADGWIITDNKREGYNPDNDEVVANTNAAEQTHDIIDHVSNGFKLRHTAGRSNNSGGTYIFMAFAEEPLVANVGQSIPATAR